MQTVRKGAARLIATAKEALATPPSRLDRLDYPRNLMIAISLHEACQLRSSQQCRWRRDSASLEPHLVDGCRDRSTLFARWERIVRALDRGKDRGPLHRRLAGSPK